MVFDISRTETLNCIMNAIMNHLRRGTFVSWKIVPLLSLNPKCVGGGSRGKKGSKKKKKERGANGIFWAIVSFREEDAKDGQERARRVTLTQRYNSETAATAILSALKGRAMTGAMRFDSKRGCHVVLDERERLLEFDERYKLKEAEGQEGPNGGGSEKK